MKERRSAFTLFELLAVLAVTGIIFMVILGSFNSWSSMHACTGATRILKAGLLQARTLAQARNKYVGFEFSTVVSNNLQQISGFQIYICTNETGNIEQELKTLQSTTSIAEQQGVIDAMGVSLAAPFQRLSNQIALFSTPTLVSFDLETAEKEAVLFFRPDGSVWSGFNNVHSHYAGIYTRKLYDRAPMVRLLRIDLATGSIETIKGEELDATTIP